MFTDVTATPGGGGGGGGMGTATTLKLTLNTIELFSKEVAEMETVPTATPVTTPVEDTLATRVLLLRHNRVLHDALDGNAVADTVSVRPT